MIVKTYKYKPYKTDIHDLGDGRVWVVYKKRPSNVDETYELAKWAVKVVIEIAAKYPGKKIKMLSEVRHKGIPHVDRRTRQEYQEVMESDLMERLVAVMPIYMYYPLKIIQSLMLRNQTLITYSPSVEDALGWLGWDEELLR